MEYPNFGPANFETSDDSPESKDKSKKKKSPESARIKVEQPDSDKKIEVAEKSKSLWERLVERDSRAAEKPETTNEENETAPTESDPDQQPESVERAEDDPTLEELSPEEEAKVEHVVAEQRLAELQSEQPAEEGSVEAAEQQAAFEFWEQQLADGEAENAPEVDANETPKEELPTEPETIENEPDEPADFEDDEPVPLSDRSSTAPSAASLHGGRGGAAVPPLPPSPGSAAPTSAPLPPSPRFGATPNRLATAPANPNVLHEPDYRVNPNATYLLVGGIVGYLIGRRRGRIKTERRMKVVQAKLEKQVEEKQQQLFAAEQHVRRQARAQYEQRFARKASESRPAMQPIAEAMPLAQRSSSRPEALAKSEAKPRPVVGETAPKIKELDRKEILTISEKIGIGNTNLRQVYESKLISESGLKRLVYEHLEGTDIRRGLAREFLAKELSYERDPRMRDLITADKAIRAAGAVQAGQDASTVLSQLNSDDNAGGDFTIPHRPAPTRQPATRGQRVSNGLLIALTLIALGLAVYAVLLGLTR